MKLSIHGLSQEQMAAIEDVAGILDVEMDRAGLPIYFQRSEQGASTVTIHYDGAEGRIEYAADHHVIRALGRFVEEMNDAEPFRIEERPAYESLGVMVDCSRNAVPHFAGFQKLVHHLALMGYSTIQLYMEDTYEIPEYPYFGYMRGRYDGSELRAMDEYAKRFGIEVVPCIQTLAHLNQPLNWPAFSQVHDVDDILLIGEEETYRLIEAMFRTLADNLQSRTIHIGMDEAHLIGLGKYLERNGYKDRIDILLYHFKRVMEIARKFGYQPMMWSDMFFRLANNGEYYAVDAPINEDVIKQIPDDIGLVYWDYYSTEQETYNKMLSKHKQLSEHIIFAAGAWKWSGFSPNNEFSKVASELAHQSCQAAGIAQVLVTAWGDNGAEASVFSILPTLQLWAELCYVNQSIETHLSRRFRTCAKASYRDFMQLDLPMLVPDNPAPGKHSINPPKYLLYQDVLCGLLDKHVIPFLYAQHYRHAADELENCAKRNPYWQTLFKVQAALCDLLELKSDLGIQIRATYKQDDREVLKYLATERIPEVKRRAERFMSLYREQWHDENKIFGLDVFDIRMGGLLQRIDAAISRIEGYLTGRYARLEELEQEILPYDSRLEMGESVAINANVWHRIASASVLAWRV